MSRVQQAAIVCLIDGLLGELPADPDIGFRIGAVMSLVEHLSLYSDLMSDGQIKELAGVGALLLRNEAHGTVAGITGDALLNRIRSQRRGE